jgi:hypothetical protein
MSQELADGVWVSTYSGRAATKEGPFHAFDFYGSAVEREHWHAPLHKATAAIAETVQDPAMFEDGVMQNMREYLKNLNRISDGEDQRGKAVEYFRPSSPAWDAYQRALSISDTRPDETIDFLDNQLSLEGFGIFTNYVMTNTALWPEDYDGKEDDPRVGMLEELRVVA